MIPKSSFGVIYFKKTGTTIECIPDPIPEIKRPSIKIYGFVDA